ncbi:MAG: sigma-70 family RNA polymerase sigma factor [Acidobacteriota bacterium]
MYPDQELIRRVLDADPEAEEELVRRCRGLAVGLARGRYGLDAERAEEVYQMTIERLWDNDRRALAAWRGRGRFSTYLTVIVTRLCQQLLAGEQKTPAAVDLDGAENAPSPSPGPDVDAAEEERRRCVASAMDELRPRDRLVLSLRFFDEREPAEIGRLLGLRGGAVRKAIFDALGRLRTQVSRRHPELFEPVTQGPGGTVVSFDRWRGQEGAK